MRYPVCLFLCLLCAGILGITQLGAQENSEPTTPAAAPAPCSAKEYRQFDFWIGTWKVTSKASPAPAENIITSHHGGCTLREDYTAGGFTGMSVNFYSNDTGKWHQTWVDNQGGSLFLSGGIVDGKMVLSSDRKKKPINRITWSKETGGAVRQLWETSTDKGKTWNVSFDGTYTKK